MRFLLTNDDGIHAPGLLALSEAARELGEVMVVAPVTAQSGCGHRVTTHEQLRVERLGPDRIAVHGTPADCVRLAMHGLAPETTWVLSGINAGGNLGADVYHSGTVAAVREAVMRGWSGIALSQYMRRNLAWDLPRARRWAALVLRELLARPREPGAFWNVNFPHLDPGAAEPALVDCPLETLPLPLSYRVEGDLLRYNGNYHERGRQTGTDVDVCFGGRIAVSRLRAF
jgi:5'-nucleotidase